MGTLDRYLTRLFLARIAIVLAGLSSLMLVLDALGHGEEFVDSPDGHGRAMLRYCLLRIPEIVTRAIPISVLLGGVLVVVSLVRSSELTAVRSVGVSQFRLLAAALPAALLVALSQVWIQDRLVPPATEALRNLGLGEEEGLLARGEDGRVWLRQGRDILRVRDLDLRGGALTEVVIFQREPDGGVTRRIAAEQAFPAERGWRLEGVTITALETGTVQRVQEVEWRSDLDLPALRSLEAHPRAMAVAVLWRSVRAGDVGSAPNYLYALWLHKRAAEPVGTVLILLLAVIMAQRLDRRRPASLAVAAAVCSGFLYLLFDGLLLSLGEAGLVAPLLAAWAPTVVFAAVAGTMALQQEAL